MPNNFNVDSSKFNTFRILLLKDLSFQPQIKNLFYCLIYVSLEPPILLAKTGFFID